MTVFIFGNPNITADSLPVKILPELQKRFPAISFQRKDPSEDFELSEITIIIDVVLGLKKPRIFNSIDEFIAPPRLTLHDFDLYSHLQFLKKLHKLPKNLKIIGLPLKVSKAAALDFIASTFSIIATRPSRNGRRNSCRGHRRG